MSAVFVLKNASFTADAGNGAGTYSVTGEFKVDTSGASQNPSAWNINIASTSGTSDFNSTYTFNTTGFANNSFTDFGPNSNSFTLCKTVSGYCDQFVYMQFNTDFKTVYQDGTALVAAVPGGVGTTTLSTIDIKLPAMAGAASASGEAGQADFVPLSPAFVGFLPVAALLARMRTRAKAAH